MVTALSLTLIHSLWQGALLYAITGLVITCTRKSPSASRYNLLVAVLAMFAVVVAGTFITELNKTGVASMPVPEGHQIVNTLPVTTGVAVNSVAPSIGAYLNRYAATIVWIWLLIVCVRCAQLLADLRGVYNLRHKNIFRIDSYWEERLRELCMQLGINRLVGIAQSGLVKTPAVIGHLKPLILVPIGMFASLSIEEAEAVLLHELAHIRRADYLVNLLQNFMEILFFFNPAVLWLSALIKAERENCCDDMVLARSSKVTYLNALVACEEYKQRSPAYVMALKGGNGKLKNRVSRIISNRNLALNGWEKSLLAICLVVAVIFVTAFDNGEKLNKLVIAAVQNDTTKRPQGNNGTEKGKFESDADRTNSIISDMIKDNIITSKDSLSFKIGTDEFVVNYKKQPEAVYQKYRAKYVVGQYSGHDDWIWYYYFDSQKYQAMLAGKYNAAKNDTTTGVFKGKLY